MTAFVLTVDYQRDCGDFGHWLKAFTTFKKAKRAMTQAVKDARTDFADLDTDQNKYSKDTMSWSIWEQGEYAYNHCDVVIQEVEIE